MSTATQGSIAESAPHGQARGLARLGAIALWLLASLIAVFFAVLEGDSATLEGGWLPRGNDSFYHARRILDAAVGTRGFYQFDERLHVPEGAWIPWPWAYDYAMAKATQLALWLAPSLDPMTFIVHVPVAWILVNAALFLAIARKIGLSIGMQALAVFCFAFSPLTQLLHWIGMVDHHYIEQTFVLLCVWLGMRWFGAPDGRSSAVALGLVLGIATAFHAGLFVLQLFPLVSVFVLWLRQSAPVAAELRAFGITLVITTLAVLLPSEPFQSGVFEFGLHSWFHLYVSMCTALAMAFMAWRTPSRRAVGELAVISALLAAPLGAQLVNGVGFLSGTFSVLDQIAEVQSPYRLFTETMGPTATAGYYSWLILLAPMLLAVLAYRSVRSPTPEQVYFSVAGTIGLLLLLSQLRLHYFGYFALVTGTLLVIERFGIQRRWHPGLVFVGAFALLAIAFQPSLRERLFVIYAPSSDPDYAAVFTLLLELEELCAEDPGTVLANTNDGNPILFHTNCSVIANNFILRAPDKTHIEEIRRLLSMAPEQIRTLRPDIKYLLLRASDFGIDSEDVSRRVSQNSLTSLFSVDAPQPRGFALVDTVYRTVENDRPTGVYARLYRVAK